MNIQEMADKITHHLLAQNEQARHFDGDVDPCAYRGDDGRSCAVGCLIADEHYALNLEGARARNELVVRAVARSIGRELDDRDIELLEAMQTVHDSFNPEEWPYELESVYNRFSLRHPPELQA